MAISPTGVKNRVVVSLLGFALSAARLEGVSKGRGTPSSTSAQGPAFSTTQATGLGRLLGTSHRNRRPPHRSVGSESTAKGGHDWSKPLVK